MKKIFLFLLSYFAISCYAAIYESNQNGQTIYSDVPQNNAKPITLPNSSPHISLPTLSTTNSPTTVTTSTVPASTAKGNYKTFTITDPISEMNYQNQRDLHVTLKLDPPLQEGDRVQLFLDSKPQKSPTLDLTQLTLQNIERGQHQVYAVIVNSLGNIIKQTESVTFYVHYSAIPTGSGAVKANP
jgi:hypothetical protein